MDGNVTGNTPLVSIIVPTYRRETELVRALNSIASLNYLNYEVIVVDDNADDIWNHKVGAIIKKFSDINKEIRIKYYANHPNQGSAKTRNIGIEMSEGAYVCFLDDDDIYLPDRIVNQLNLMLENNADYSITDLALYNENDKLVEFRKRDYIKETTSENLFQYHLMYHMTGTDTLMFKKEYLTKIGGFDPINVGDEFYLMSKAILGKGKFLYVPKCDVKAYVHSAGGGLSSGSAKIDGENRLYDYKKKYFGNLSKDTRKYIEMRHHLVLGLAYAKEKKWCKVLKEGFEAVLADYKSCFLLVMNRKKCNLK